MKPTEEECFVKESKNLDENVLEPSSESGGEVGKAPGESLVSSDEWVCKSPNGGFSTTSGWRSFDIKPSSQTYILSAEEQATVAVLNLQNKALEACQKFLNGNVDSDGDEDEDEDEDDNNNDNDNDNDDENEDEDKDELVDNYDSKECKEYKFFERVFAEDDELRRYYENNYKDGDFYCLVCGGIGKKVWKRFKDCIALIQHSTAILRTRRMRAHRAYAQVICNIIGWDIDQLPAIVLKDSDSSLAGSAKLLVDPKNPAAGCLDVSNVEPDNSTDNHTDD